MVVSNYFQVGLIAAVATRTTSLFVRYAGCVFTFEVAFRSFLISSCSNFLIYFPIQNV